MAGGLDNFNATLLVRQVCSCPLKGLLATEEREKPRKGRASRGWVARRSRARGELWVDVGCVS